MNLKEQILEAMRQRVAGRVMNHVLTTGEPPSAAQLRGMIDDEIDGVMDVVKQSITDYKRRAVELEQENEA